MYGAELSARASHENPHVGALRSRREDRDDLCGRPGVRREKGRISPGSRPMLMRDGIREQAAARMIRDEATDARPRRRKGPAMQIRDIDLDDLVLDPALNLRDRLDDDTVDALHRRLGPHAAGHGLRGRGPAPPGRRVPPPRRGRHARQADDRRRGPHGTFAEAMDFVAGANLFHGLPLTRAERRRAIEIKLRLHHDRSDRHLAEEMSVGRELVAKIRRQLVESNQIPAGTTRARRRRQDLPVAAAEGPERAPPQGQDQLRAGRPPRPEASRERPRPLGRCDRPDAGDRRSPRPPSVRPVGRRGRRQGRSPRALPSPSPRRRSRRCSAS